MYYNIKEFFLDNKFNIYNTIVKSAETKVQINYQCTLSLISSDYNSNNSNDKKNASETRESNQDQDKR